MASFFDWLKGILGGATPTPLRQSQVPGPARLLVMRHAEKTGDPQDMHLSEPGRQRAARLATYIPEAFGRPDFLIAAMRSKHSNRSYETLVPLSERSGIPIVTDFKDTDALALAAALKANATYAGRFGVISWHHSALPGLIAALGASEGSYPDPWDPDVFNLLIEMNFNPGRAPGVRQIAENF